MSNMTNTYTAYLPQYHNHVKYQCMYSITTQEQHMEMKITDDVITSVRLFEQAIMKYSKLKTGSH